MGDEVRLWRVGADERLIAIDRGRLDLESRLQEWLAADISVLDPGLLVIGREVETEFGGFIDILCIDSDGNLVIAELKRDKTPREVTAQALDYASWVATLSYDHVTSIAREHLAVSLEESFRAKFNTDLPETLNTEHRILIVGSAIDVSSERIIKYLSERVNINAATFQYFQLPDGPELVSRVFLVEPSEVETRTKATSKRRPNLTYEELDALAVEAGVEELYRYAVTSFEPLLQKHRTMSSINFAALLSGSRKTVINLLPAESSASDGLLYHVYKNRYAELTGLADVEPLMPVRHDNWSFSPTLDADWHGFEGFINSKEEIDRLATPLRRSSTTPVAESLTQG